MDRLGAGGVLDAQPAGEDQAHVVDGGEPVALAPAAHEDGPTGPGGLKELGDDLGEPAVLEGAQPSSGQCADLVGDPGVLKLFMLL